MSRRKKEGTWIALIVEFVGLMFLLSLFSPQVRQAIASIGFLFICVLCLAVVGLIGFAVYRYINRSQLPETTYRSIDCQKLEVEVQREPQSRPTIESGGEPQTQTTADLIEQLHAIDWFQFEKLCALVYRQLGYAVTRRGGANPDGGIDLLIEKDGHQTGVQCKQWKTWNVGQPHVSQFLGALTNAGIQKGIFITLRGYTGPAKKFAGNNGIEIVNKDGFAEMLENTDARFDPEALEILRDTRKFCPKCEDEMVLRIARKGREAGGQFWGCSGYPRCRFTMRSPN